MAQCVRPLQMQIKKYVLIDSEDLTCIRRRSTTSVTQHPEAPKKIMHFAIFIRDNNCSQKLIDEILKNQRHKEFLDLSSMHGAVFSNASLAYYLSEELLHERFLVVPDRNRGLNTMSSGEQKSALLKYLLSQSLEYIIVDNILDNLDKEVQENVLHDLEKFSSTAIIIQVYNRHKDILPFISNCYIYEGSEILKNIYIDKGVCVLKNEIPETHVSYTLGKEIIVRFRDVSVHYDSKPILNAIHWEIKMGEFWQLIGPNGSGKSTLLSMITGDNPKAYGQDLILFGRKKGSGESVWEIKAKIGYFNPALTHNFSREYSLEQMIVSGFFDSIGLYFQATELQLKIARDWLLVLGLEKDAKKSFLSFSLGLQRIVLIARAMVKHPPLLILDEPTSGLDDDSAALCVSLINRIASKKSTAIVYVSHRKEPGLTADYVFELFTDSKGSIGKIRL